MTISMTSVKIIYVGTGSTAGAAKIFAYPFKINADADIDVQEYNTITSVSTIKTLNSQYAVTGAGSDSGGNVLLTGTYTNLPTASQLVIRRIIPILQETDYVENDPFSAETLEDQLDKCIMIDQQQQEAIDRCVQALAVQWSANIDITVFNQVLANCNSAAVVATGEAAIAGSYAAVSLSQSSYAQSAAASAVAAASSATVAVAQVSSCVVQVSLASVQVALASYYSGLVPSPAGQTAGYSLVVNATQDGWLFTAGGTLNTVSVSRQSFGSASLSAGVLDITHGQTLTKPYSMMVNVYNSNGYMVIPDNVTVSASTVHIGLSTANFTVTGTWGVTYVA